MRRVDPDSEFPALIPGGDLSAHRDPRDDSQTHLKAHEEQKLRIEMLEARFKDLKTWGALAVTSMTAIFAVVAVVFSFNLNSEKDDLREFRDRLEADLRASLGDLGEPAKVVLSTMRGGNLAGATVDGEVRYDESGAHFLAFNFILSNEGGRTTGPLFIKLYTPQGLNIGFFSSDEPEYAYETVWRAEDLAIGEYAPGMSTGFSQFPSMYETVPGPGRNDVLLKVYYGRTDARFPFTLRLSAEE